MTTTPPPGQVGRAHPSTAKEAADRSGHSNLDHRERILLRLLANGDHGATAAELSAELGISTQLCGSRLLELRGDGCATGKFPVLAQRTDRKRAASEGGRPGFVHVLNVDGQRAARFIAQQQGVPDDGRIG